MTTALWLCLGYAALALIGVRGLRKAGTPSRWLLVTLALMLAAQATYLLPADAQADPAHAAFFPGGLTQPSLAVLAQLFALSVFGGLTLRFLMLRFSTGFVGLGVILIVVTGLAVMQGNPQDSGIGMAGWLTDAFAPSLNFFGLGIIAAWAAGGMALIGAVMYRFATAYLSELINRAMFWLLVVPLVWMGGLAGMSGNNLLREAGWLLQFGGMVGACYAILSHRVLDVRRVFRFTFASILSAGLTFIVIMAALFLVAALPQASFFTILGVGVLATLAYVPLRAVGQFIVDRLFGRPLDESTSLVREYSQTITGVVELKELSDYAVTTLRRTLRVRAGMLILATAENDDTIRVEPMASPLVDAPDLRGWIPRSSAVYRTLFEQHRPMLQYDVEYSPEFAEVALELKSFFRALRMNAYAPIVMQGQVIGILAAANRVNDEPFTPADLELLATLATTTGVALRNARLVSDLRTARDQTEALNRDIIRTKERLERLDAVKTDFVTIASHELRTPLTQIRGYSDILEALAESPRLEPYQIAGVTNNVRKATDRLEQLIADMLDVSRLGLDAMDMRLGLTTIDSVLRLSIEPLAESIKQRELQLTARGLRGLPEIQGDTQRLVQAFRNIILNAIKYTPDGGRIDISGQLQQNPETGKDEILIKVKDTGIGIDPKNHELIFEKFFRVGDPGLHSTGATKFMGAGPGLGLTIARGVINGHGGRIWVESPGFDMEKLPGTTVFVTLPVNREVGGPARVDISSGKMPAYRPTPAESGSNVAAFDTRTRKG